MDQTELDILQSSSFGPESPLWRKLPRPVPMEEAYARLHRGLQPTAELEAAYARLSTVKDTPLSAHLLVKMFNDIDTNMFHGTLRRRVCLRWVDVETLSRIKGSNAGLVQATTAPAGMLGPRTHLLMRCDFNWSQWPRRRAALATMLHEMVHCFFEICCGDEGSDEPGPDPGHGPMFQAGAELIGWMTDLNLLPGSEEIECFMAGAQHT